MPSYLLCEDHDELRNLGFQSTGSKLFDIFLSLRHEFYSLNHKIMRAINTAMMEAQEQLIAEATVIGDHLLVFSCSMEKFEVPFSSLPTTRTF